MHHTHTHTCTHGRTHTHTHNQRSLTASVPSKCTCSTWCHFLKNESCWLTLNEFYFHVSRRDKYIRVIRPSTEQQAAAPTCSEKPQGRTVQMLLAKLFFKGEKYFFPTSKTILKTALKQKLTPVKIQNQLSIICNIRLAVEFFCCSLFFLKKTKQKTGWCLIFAMVWFWSLVNIQLMKPRRDLVAAVTAEEQRKQQPKRDWTQAKLLFHGTSLDFSFFFGHVL